MARKRRRPRSRGYDTISGDRDHTAVLRLLSDRHRDLVSLRTQTVCRLHVLLRELIPGGAPVRLRADRAAVLLRRVRPTSPVEVERKRLAQDLLVDIRRLDRDLGDVRARITAAIAASRALKHTP